MGQKAFIDLGAFRTAQLHRQGIHVAVAMLPLHGPRPSGQARSENLMTIAMADGMHGMAQANWDVRQLIRWLRDSRLTQG